MSARLTRVSARLTPARRRGLEEIAERQRAGEKAFRSNTTASGTGLVYWQTVDWLVDNGLAELYGLANYFVRLTSAGLELARGEGLR